MLNYFSFSNVFRNLVIKNGLQNFRIISNYHNYNLVFHHTVLCNGLQKLPKANDFLLQNQNWSSCFQPFNGFYCSSLQKQNDTEIRKILSSSENKLYQLNVFNTSKILDLITKQQELENSMAESDLLRLSDLIVEAAHKNKIDNPNLIETFGEVLLSLKGLNSVEKLLCNFLSACLKSKSTFPYEGILKFMEKNNYSWSEKIFEYLLSNLCIRNKIEEVEEVFLKMKSLNLTLNDNIYSSLIRLYGKNKDLEKVNDILSSMKNDGIEPSPSSQSALVVTYNICEEYEKGREVLEEIFSSEKVLENDQFSDILISAIETGCYDKNFDYFSFILNSKDKLVKTGDVKNLINHLMSLNYLKEVTYILSKEDGTLPSDSNYLTLSADVIRELIKVNKNDPSAVVSFCDELVKEKVNDFAFEIALEDSLTNQHFSLSYELLKCLKMKRQLNEHFFWPFFASSAFDLGKTLEIVDKMNEFGVTIGLDTLLIYIIPSLPLETAKLSLQILPKHGLSKSRVLVPLLSTLISRGLFEEVYDLLSDNCIPFTFNSLLFEPLAKVYYRNQEVGTELFLALYHHRYHVVKEREEIINQFESFVRKVSRGKIRKTTVVSFLKKIEYERFISKGQEKSEQYSPSNSFEDVHSNVFSFEEGTDRQAMNDPYLKIPATYSSDAGSLVAAFEPTNNTFENGDINERKFKHFSSHPSSSEKQRNSYTDNLSIEELECHLVELKLKKMKTRGVLRKLLLKHSLKGNQGRIEEISKELENLESQLSPGMVSTTMYNKVLEGNAEEAIKLFNLIYESNPDFKIDSYKVVDLCSFCARVGRVQDSLEVMKKYIQVTPKTYHRKKSILHNCHELLVNCSKGEGYKFAKEMSNLLLSGGLVDPSSVILGPLIKCKLERNDLVGAVEESEDIFSTFKVLPLRVETLVHILKCEDDDVDIESLVDRVVTLISKSRGRKQAKVDLLTASLHAENEEMSEKIFKSVKNDLHMEAIKRLCDYFVKGEKVSSLKMLFNVSRGSNNVDRLHICECLLNIYFVNRNSKDALNLSTQMQEESLNPSPTFRTKLATLLKVTGSSNSALGTIL